MDLSTSPARSPFRLSEHRDQPTSRRQAMTALPNGIAQLSRAIDPAVFPRGESAFYDLVMRLPILLWSTGLAFLSATALRQFVKTADPTLPDAAFYVNIAMRLSVIAYLMLLGLTVIMRKPPVGKACGMEPRISALTGSFLIMAIAFFPRRELSLPLGIASTLLVLTGEGFAVVILMQLRSSFSIMPEARELITSGLYRFVRHPLYLAEEIAAVGSVMQFFSVWTVMLFLLHIAFQLRRIWHEEVVLSQVFPEYSMYKVKTSQILPEIY
jgi:protein-S-isoprenylcysteine O-methyltransferase Ste14